MGKRGEPETGDTCILTKFWAHVGSRFFVLPSRPRPQILNMHVSPLSRYPIAGFLAAAAGAFICLLFTALLRRH